MLFLAKGREREIHLGSQWELSTGQIELGQKTCTRDAGLEHSSRC